MPPVTRLSSTDNWVTMSFTESTPCNCALPREADNPVYFRADGRSL